MPISFHLPSFDQLTPQMQNLVNFPIDSNLLVVGSPGTGKSVVAIYRYKELLKQGKRVVFLCYNKLLNTLLRNICDSNLYVRTLDSLYGYITYTNNNNQNYNGPMIGNEDIQIVKEHFASYVLKKGQFDAILVDEAQDLSIEILQALTILSPHVSLFADPNQPLKDPSCDIGEIEYIFDGIHKETLVKNYRNTKQIYEFAAQQFMSGNELANNPSLTSDSLDDATSTPIIEQGITTLDQQVKKIETYIKTYTGQTIGIFLNTVEEVNSLYDTLIELGYDPTKYYNRDRDHTYDSSKSILITTYASAKGLEFDVAIIIITETARKEDKLNQKLYVLSTRAKKKLYYLFA